jgi:hypothetical protein
MIRETTQVMTMLDILETITANMRNQVRSDLGRLEGAYVWGLAQQPVAAGDSAVFKKDYPHIDGPGHGWWCYRHLFVAGSCVDVVRVQFNDFINEWVATIQFEDEWMEMMGTWSDHVERRSTYKSPGGDFFERPDNLVGFRPHKDNRHVFNIDVRYLGR